MCHVFIWEYNIKTRVKYFNFCKRNILYPFVKEFSVGIERRISFPNRGEGFLKNFVCKILFRNDPADLIIENVSILLVQQLNSPLIAQEKQVKHVLFSGITTHKSGLWRFNSV